MNQILIDRFEFPQDAKEVFLERVKINREFIKTIPGFLGDEAYIQEGNDKILFLTIATWENQTCLDNAKTMVFSEYQRQGFVMQDFLTRHSIRIEREIYKRMF